MIEENKALIRQYLAALSGKDKPESIINIYVSDEKLKQHIKLFESAFPRYKLTIEDMIAEGDKVAVRVTFQGIHRGEFMGIKPASREITISGMLIYRIVNGKIVEFWRNFDNLGVMEQLGGFQKTDSMFYRKYRCSSFNRKRRGGDNGRIKPITILRFL